MAQHTQDCKDLRLVAAFECKGECQQAPNSSEFHPIRGTDRQLQHSVDRAVAAENRNAIAHPEDAPVIEPEPRYPAGTPEYEAFRARLREELAAWVIQL